MKRLFIIVLATISAQVFAQNKNVVSAINYLGYYQKDKAISDLLDAKTYIDLATENVDTKENAKTWSYRGKIYLDLYNSKDPKAKETAPTALDEAAKAFAQCIKLDVKGNYADSKNFLNNCALFYGNKGVKDFTDKDYAGAFAAFESSINIKSANFNIIDTGAIYNAAVAAEKANNFAKAKEYYSKLIDIKYGGEKDGAKVYFYIASLYKQEKDDANYIATIQKGRAAFPNDKMLVIEELNYYLLSGKIKEAINNLDIAISKDPNNEVLYYNKGTLYDNLATSDKPKPTDAEKKEYTEKAEAAYKKALEINPSYFDALYNIGAMYFNKAVNINNAASDIKDQKKYDAEVKKADDVFKQSLPYLEKADQVGSTDKSTYKSLLQTLQKLYLMTEQPEKAAAIKKKME